MITVEDPEQLPLPKGLLGSSQDEDAEEHLGKHRHIFFSSSHSLAHSLNLLVSSSRTS